MPKSVPPWKTVAWSAYQAVSLAMLTIMLLRATFIHGNALAALFVPATLIATVTALEPVAAMLRDDLNLRD